MPIKKLTLGLVLLLSASAFAANKTYTVRNGDHDWSIAKKFGMTPAQLRKLNPGVKWTRLQIGQKIVVGRTSSSSVSTASKTKAPTVAKGSHTVVKGDNDWTIARKYGTTSTALRKLNPGVKWDRLAIGTKLKVPGAAPKTSTVAAKTTTKPAVKTPTVAQKASAAKNPITAAYAAASKDSVIVRKSPSTSAGKVTTVAQGATGTVIGKSNEWVKLKFPQGTIGWVRSDLLRNATKPSIVASKPTTVATAATRSKTSTLLSRANSMRGVRYRYGAMSRSAVDCSGFTTHVFKSIGVSLPRTSAQQATVGVAVSKSNLQPGDLVFFRTTRGRRISHVGIYQGKGQFIHASSGGGKVQVNSLNEGYYKSRYVTARRVSALAGRKVSMEEAVEIAEAEKLKQDTAEAAGAAPASTTSAAEEIVR